MPFKHPMRAYTRANIEALDLSQNEVYGIFKDQSPIYIGSGDIRTRLLAHINGDNSCIVDPFPQSVGW